MRAWINFLLASAAVAAQEAEMKCIICRGKLSKREKKYHKAAGTEVVFCTDCVIRRNHVCRKMKKVGAAA